MRSDETPQEEMGGARVDARVHLASSSSASLALAWGRPPFSIGFVHVSLVILLLSCLEMAYSFNNLAEFFKCSYIFL